MRGFVANTDFDWFTSLRDHEPAFEEVNFWKPGSNTRLSGLKPGEPLLFKLKAPHNMVAGFGHFVHSSIVPTRLAWDVYDEANGAPDYVTFRSTLTSIRRGLGIETPAVRDFDIGCVLLINPVFFDESDWVRAPSDFKTGTVQWKGYDLSEGEGRRVWTDCLLRAQSYQRTGQPAASASDPQSIADRPLPGGYGSPSVVVPRLGQRSFRIAVLDSYERRCAVTSERTLPALEAAHIRDYRDVQEHTIANGILLRADLHKLFDAGYVTVNPDYRFEVSKRIKEEFENGRDYYAMQGKPIRLPPKLDHRPLTDALAWHNDNRFLG